MDKQPFTDQDLKGWAKVLAIGAAVLLVLQLIVPEDCKGCVLAFWVCYGGICFSLLCGIIGYGVISDEEAQKIAEQEKKENELYEDWRTWSKEDIRK